MKNILILGGSYDQYASVKTVNELSYNSIVIDKNNNCFCKKFSNIFINVSTRDAKVIIYELNKRNIIPDSIIVQGTDIPHIGSKIANHFGINYISEESSLISIDKYKLKILLKKK